MHRFTENCKIVSAMIPQTLSTDSTMDAVDTFGYNSAVVMFHIGNSGDTLSGSVKIECELEHGDTSTTADCPDTALSASVTGTNTGTAALIDAPAEDSRTVTVQYTGNKRYLKPVINLTGTHTNGTPCACTVVLFDPHVLPAA